MAVTIIGECPTVKKQVACDKCGALLEYHPIDIVKRGGKDYDGTGWVSDTISCPRCAHTIVLSTR